MTKYCIVLVIMDMAKKKYISGDFELKSDKNPEIRFQKRKYPIYIA